MRFGHIVACFGLIAFLFVLPFGAADDPFQWTGDLGPKDIEGFPLVPTSETETMDITVSSDRPITIFIVDTQEGYENLIGLTEDTIENFTNYVQKYEGQTYKEITQDYDSERSYWVILYNPSDTDTAEVTVDYDFWGDITDDIIDDAASNACCLLTMGVGTAGILVLASSVILARKRRK